MSRGLATGKLSDWLLTAAILGALVGPLASDLALPLGPFRLGFPGGAAMAAVAVLLISFRALYRRHGAEWRRALGRSVGAHRATIALVVIVGVGLYLRLRAIEFGLPVIVHPDEPSVAGVALGMLRSGWIDPAWYIYPTLFMNLLLPGFALYYIHGRGEGIWASLEEVSDLDPGFYLVARYHSAILGTLTIVLSYWLARRLWPGKRGRRIGLAAAAVVAFSFIHVRESHYAVTDAPLAFFVAGAMIAICAVLSRRRVRDYAVAGLLCGMAASVKYTALPLLAPLASAHLIGQPVRRWLGIRPAVAVGATVVGFLIGSPYALLNWKPFLEHLGWLNTFAGGVAPDQLRRNFVHILGYAAESGFGFPVLVAAIAGIALAAHRRRPRELLLAILIVATIPQLIQSSHPFFPRFLVPLVPVVAVLAGASFDAAALHLARWRRAPWIAAPVLFLLALAAVWNPATESLSFVRLYSRLDTRTAAYDFIVESVAPGTTVASEVAHFRLPRGYRVLEWRPLHERGLKAFREEGVAIIVITDGYDGFATGRTNGARIRSRLRGGELLARFGGDDWEGPGPKLAIYRVVDGLFDPSEGG